jgi:hypothetical protein
VTVFRQRGQEVLHEVRLDVNVLETLEDQLLKPPELLPDGQQVTFKVKVDLGKKIKRQLWPYFQSFCQILNG